MKKFRKFAAVVVAFMMLTTTLAACGNNNPLKLSLSTKDSVTSVLPGQSVEFVATVVEGEANESIVYSITSGGSNATINSSTGEMDVLPGATYGAEITVVASCGDVNSNAVTVTVATPSVTSVTIGSNVSGGKVLAGQVVTLSASWTPSNVTATVNYTITAGSDYATLSDNMLTVNSDAAVDSVIKVKATVRGVDSDELTFTVGLAADSDLTISLDSDVFQADKNAASQTKISLDVIDGEGRLVKDAPIVYTVTEGIGLITVSDDGAINAIGHGTAKVEVRVEGTNATAFCTVNSIVPPDSISMPSDLPQNESVNFAFGLHDYDNGNIRNSALTFVPNITGTNVCQDYTVTFSKITDGNAAIDTQSATYNYETKEITFTEVGRFVISVTSNSGSVKETTYQREILINNGINVKTMADFIDVMNNYNTQNEEMYKSVNLFADLTGFDGSQGEQTVDMIRNQTIASYGDRYLYGNDYSIDLSNVRIITQAERTSSGSLNVPDFMNFKGYGSRGGDGYFYSSQKLFTVEIYDFSLTGNLGASTSFDKLDLPPKPTGGIGDGTPANRAYRRGINISGEHRYYDDDYNAGTPEVLDEANAQVCKNMVMQNVTVSGFYIGTTLQAIVNGNVTGCTFTDAYASSVDTLCSQITFRDVTFGQCGVAGIELTASYFDEAGESFNQKQSIKFEGTIVCDNWANGKSHHMAYDDTLNVFMDIVKENLPDNADAMSNMLVSEDQGINWLIYVAAGDADAISDIQFNASTVADAPDTGKDTTHEFLRKTVSYGDQALGVIYVGNLNYQG